MTTTQLHVDGLNCPSCAQKVRTSLLKIAGVDVVDISLETNQATVTWASSATPHPDVLIESLRRIGYPARLMTPKDTPDEHGHSHMTALHWKMHVALGGVVTVFLLGSEWFTSWHMTAWYGWLAFILTLPVQIVVGQSFYKNAWAQVRAGQSSMDTLVALGSTAAFGLSVYGLLKPGAIMHLHFSEAAAILTVISLGHHMEARLSEHAGDALRALLHLAPAKASRIQDNGIEEDVPVRNIQCNDHIRIRPGDTVPLDGEIIEGESSINESMLTGESLPSEKTIGHFVYAGTMNQSGTLLVRVTALGEETALANIIRVVKRAQQSRAKIQKTADMISSVFVPIIFLIALATVLWWGLNSSNGWERGIVNAIGVLIVACPCAMGLATPAALMAATGRAAKTGILLRDASAIEKCGNIDTILFDKTGTLTLGTPQVIKVQITPGFENHFASLVASIACHSQHPLSQSLCTYFQSANRVPMEKWQEIHGSGVMAKHENQTVRLGSITWLQTEGVHMGNIGLSEDATCLALGVDTVCAGWLHLRDEPRNEAAHMLHLLKEQGLQTGLISGDRENVTRAIASKLGIQPALVFAATRPELKSSIVLQLQQQGHRVAFVGDGINDAPALAQADLGMAVGNASDVAQEAADIILLHSGVEIVPEALELCRKTLRVINQNFFWAIIYNALLVPCAVMGWVPPIACALAMGISDIMIIGNSLRLLYVPARSSYS